jgi:hypothetical protein
MLVMLQIEIDAVEPVVPWHSPFEIETYVKIIGKLCISECWKSLEVIQAGSEILCSGMYKLI